MISVIVTIYNTEKYLKRCLDSILQQEYSDYELIAVNNGSTDHSAEIIKEYMESCDKIYLVDIKKNQGPGMGRNVGIENARGEYIVFVDSDDILLPDGLSILYEAIKDGQYDFVCANYKFDFSENSAYKNLPFTITSNDSLENIKLILYYGISPTPWAKIFQKKVFENNVRFSLEGVDDAPFFYQLILTDKSIKIINTDVYRYMYNETSYMHTHKNFYSICKQSNDTVNKFVDECLLRFNREEKYFYTYQANMYIIAFMSYLINSFKYGALLKKDHIKELWEPIRAVDIKNILSTEEFGKKEYVHIMRRFGKIGFKLYIWIKAYLVRFKYSWIRAKTKGIILRR